MSDSTKICSSESPSLAIRVASSVVVLLAWAFAVAAVNCQAAPALLRAAVFSDRPPGGDETFAREIAGQVSAAGYAVEFIGVGFLVVVLLSWLRMRFLAFPFHPLAYALASSWGVGQLWMPLLIGSTAKFIALRSGGLANYRRVLPFFYGLMLGEIVIGSLWTIIGIVLGIPTYDFWPGKYQ